jgi:hypothetical protein
MVVLWVLGVLLSSFYFVNGQKPVDATAFPGHYFTEAKIEMPDVVLARKKRNEIDLTFDANTGILCGTASGFGDAPCKITFSVDDNIKRWATETKIWFWANEDKNAISYGKDMFDKRKMNMATFIEEGLLVLFDAYPAGEEERMKGKVYVVKQDPDRVRLLAKDRSKLKIDKMEAVKRAEALINEAAGYQMKKLKESQQISALRVPEETLSKTNKVLKAEINSLLKSFIISGDNHVEFICAYTTSLDWTVNSNIMTGEAESREIIAEMILKNRKSGKCWRMPYTLISARGQYGYGKLEFKQKWNLQECDCSLAGKNK